MNRTKPEYRKWMYGCVLVLIIGCLHYFEFHQKFFTPLAGTVIPALPEKADTKSTTAGYSEIQIQKP